ncbi:hypothetical protein [Pleurochrysis sp. endemic virus unk]|nr:hypothetical protein [Pleurochrysis sp. endemic virus unk]
MLHVMACALLSDTSLNLQTRLIVVNKLSAERLVALMLAHKYNILSALTGMHFGDAFCVEYV